MSASTTFDNDVDVMQRFLQDVSSGVNERDAARRSGAAAGGDTAGRIRTALTKAEKQLEKLTAASRSDVSSALL